MKKVLIAILLNVLMMFPLFINADTYEHSEEISNSYMNRTNFKNSYNKYIFIHNNKLGDMITKEEFEITRYNKNKDYKSIAFSYLWDSNPFWSKSKDGEKYISISNGYSSYSKNDETNTKNIKTKVTEYTKNKVIVLGNGTYSDPWLFAPEYKIYIKVNDITKGYITDKTDKNVKKEFVEFYLTSYSLPEYIYINSIDANKYIGSTCGYIINGIAGNKDMASGNGPYLLLSNVTRDIECTINFGEKPSEIILSQDYTECGKSSPEKLYFKTNSGWYSDEYGNTSINKLVQNPCRIGYTFDGYRNSSSFANACSSSKIIEENGKLDNKKSTLMLLTNKQTLYPCYIPNVYTISYDVNGGDVLTATTKEVIFDSQYGTLPTPTRTGYIFAGWYSEKENGTKITSSTKVTNPSNHTIYAHWTPITYGITYDTKGGSLGTKAPTSNLKFDEVVEISYPTRQGYDFSGWTASGNNLNTSTAKFGSTINNVKTNPISSTSTKITTNYLINLTTTNNGSITLTATWTARNDTKYTVKHWKQKLNGGTSKNTTNYELDKTENLEGTTDTNASSTVKTYTGFTSPSKQTPKINADGSTVINYYYDRNEYTVTISSNNTSYGTVSSSSVKLDHGNTYSVSSSTLSFTNGTDVTANATSATGYTTSFSNWSSTSGTITSNTTLTANFSRTAHKYTVQYDCNSGGSSTSDSSHTYDVEKALTTNGCTRTGYTFGGWSKTSTGSATYTNGQKVKNLTSTNNDTVKLYAVWSINSYNVTIDKGTGIESVTGTGNYDYDVNVTLGYTLKTGYHFVNWTGDKTTASFKMPASNVKMTANGAANTYTVKYDCNGGTGSTSDSSHTYDVEKALTTNGCTRTGYTFGGWSKTSTGSATYTNRQIVKNLTSTNNDTVKLYAVWSINSYNVTIDKGTGIESVTGAGNYNYDANVTLGYTLKTGYHFVNWTGDKTTASFKMPASNVKMTANGAANTYIVKYNCNGGTGSTADSSHTYDVEKALTTNGCSKDNNNFKGWNSKQDGSGNAYADRATVKNLTAVDKGTVTLYAQWQLADAENPKCTITVASSGLTLNPTDDKGVHSYDLTTSNSATYSNNKTKALSKATFYGYVKDTAGKTGSCSVTISDATASKYTCSKSAIKYSYPSCDTAAKYSSPSSACAAGTTYSSNSCTRSNTYAISYESCKKNSEGKWIWASAGTEYGKESCSEGTKGGCSASTGSYTVVTRCETLTSYKYSGYVTCYTYYCNSDEGTYDSYKCYKYNQSSCASGWSSSVSAYSCGSGKTLVSGTAYCKSN